MTSNRDRVNRAKAVLHTYAGDSELTANITDLLTDLMHLCEAEKIPFENRVTMARIHFEEES